ncbi:lysophospholipase D GDPD3-like, partial [Dryobates pubescens]|uniref:lysophospholipase D GDPD3-like n=1 Tax=Dryobates pubescens TaxID=118200 RepID=UPI0023B8C0D7
MAAAAAAAAAALGVTMAAVGRRLRGRRIREGPRLPFTARLVAHRGGEAEGRRGSRSEELEAFPGAGERIENTLEAFEHAVSCGADWLELDVRRTKDGVLVVFHDQDLARACGTPGAIRDLNYGELPPYRCPLEVTFSPGQFSTGCDRRIPRLEEVFQRFPRQPISIEVKDDDDELINEVAALVRAYDRAPITIWASFREPILAKCRRAHPSMPYCFSLRRGLLLLLLYYCRLLPWVPLGEAVLLFVLPGIIN